MSGMRERGKLGTAAPSTPDANNRQVSKRKWESLVMHWRWSLQQYSSDFDALTLMPSPGSDAQLRHDLTLAEQMADECDR